MGRKLWVTADIPDNAVRGLIDEFKFPRPIALFLAARGLFDPAEVRRYLKSSLRGLTDPYRFPGMEAAVARLWEAISQRERVLIHGDYDTDGITSTVLLEGVLRQNGAEVHTFLPHRFEDGYGFTPDSLDKGLEQAGGTCGVLVTVDCGVTSVEAVEKARSLGIDVIITDHHEPAETIPPALALINAKMHDELSDLHLLSGVGVAFKLAHAFVKYGKENKLGGYQTNLQETLDLVALGTIADIVPLLGENRILVKHGIKVLSRQLRPGIRALFETVRINSKLRPSDITFKLAPRINAAGRLGDANKALQLLKTNNILDAYRFAADLEKYNNERQATEEKIFKEAQAQLSETFDMENDASLLVAGEDWHQGVIGIVASRLCREYNRPAIVLSIQGDEAFGSGRSVGTFNMVEALSECSDLLSRFGGHPMAVGLGLERDNLRAFFDRFRTIVNDKVSRQDLVDYWELDGEITLDELTSSYFEIMDSLGPFGHSNPNPIFLIKNLDGINVYSVGGNHVKGKVRGEKSDVFDYIAFNRAASTMPDTRWDIVAMPQLNEYRGNIKPQLQIMDVRPSA